MEYDACEDALEGVDADISAAEMHGVLCAMLCTRQPVRIRQWVDEIVICEGGLGAARHALDALGERTSDALLGSQFQLSLLLPSDERSLGERAQALCDWCTGFLHGLGLAGDTLRESLSDEGREVVADLIELTRLDASADDDDEGEAAFAELVEYVRVGVMLIYEELMRSRSPLGERSLH